jgi:predicted ribosomally synthesized peptide with SipW-like signal peptide
MNSKLVKASLAGAAAIALAAGGGTYASWSDQQTFNSNQAAGTLDLTVTSGNNQGLSFNNGQLAPGLFKETRILVNGVDTTAYPADGNKKIQSTLSFAVGQVTGTEDGCHATESTVDGNCAGTNQGELPGSLLVNLGVADPDSSGVCPSGGYTPVIVDKPMATGSDGGWTSNIAATDFATGSGSYKKCVDLQIQMDPNSDNSTQGDKANWDAVFHLQQNV